MASVFICHESEDSFTAVASYVAGIIDAGKVKTALAETEGNTLIQSCKECCDPEQRNYSQYISLLTSYINLLFTNAEKDVEHCLSVMTVAIPYIPSEGQAGPIRLFVEALTQAPDHAEIRLATLLRIFTVCTDPATRFQVLLAALNFAKQTPKGNATVIAAIKDKVSGWIAEWGLGAEDKKRFLFKLAEAYRSVDSRSYLRYLTLGLTYASADDEAARNLAVAALVDTVKLPGVFTCDLFDLPVLQGAEGDEVVELVRVMVKGDLAAFSARLTPSVLARLDVPREAALERARFFALLALGVAAEHQDLPLSRVGAALEVPAEDVERWIVRAIGLKLIDGKINQVQDSFFVSRCTYPSFGAAQWQELAGKIQSAISLIA